MAEASPEPQRGDRYLAWGVSPRNRGQIKNVSPRGATEKSSRALICRRSAARNYFRHSTWGSRPRLFIFRASGAPIGTTHGPERPTTIRIPNSEFCWGDRPTFPIPHSQFLIRLGWVAKIPKSKIFQSFLFPLAHPTCHSDRGNEETPLPVIPTEGAKRPPSLSSRPRERSDRAEGSAESRQKRAIS